MFNELRGPIESRLNHGGWYFWASMQSGTVTMPVFQNLEAFWPGLLSLVGDHRSALKSLRNYHSLWRKFGFIPEFLDVVGVRSKRC